MFDGHGGVDAAIYASVHLHVNLVRQEMFPHDPAEALCRAFRVTDERFVQKAAREVCPRPCEHQLEVHQLSSIQSLWLKGTLAFSLSGYILSKLYTHTHTLAFSLSGYTFSKLYVHTHTHTNTYSSYLVGLCSILNPDPS